MHVSLKKNIDDSYDIVFTSDVARQLKNFLSERNISRCLIVSDNKVRPLYGEQLECELEPEILSASFVFPSWEEHKNMTTLIQIIEKLQTLHFGRKDYLVALGGGVVGDITGFAAAIYKRGMNYIQVPTTLLSILDSSVGGKTAVDYREIKNLIGAFKQPQHVIINKNFLKTLPQQELLSGYSEGLKHSLLLDGEAQYASFVQKAELLFTNLEDPEIEHLLQKNIAVKVQIVQQDEQETKGIRNFLNYGHTFGHAIESCAKFTLVHGICIGFGMIYENLLAVELWLLEQNIAENINAHIRQKLSNISLPKLAFPELLAKMKNDKKNNSDAITFSLLIDYGQMQVVEVEDEKMLEDVFSSVIASR